MLPRAVAVCSTRGPHPISVRLRVACRNLRGTLRVPVLPVGVNNYSICAPEAFLLHPEDGLCRRMHKLHRTVGVGEQARQAIGISQGSFVVFQSSGSIFCQRKSALWFQFQRKSSVRSVSPLKFEGRGRGRYLSGFMHNHPQPVLIS